MAGSNNIQALREAKGWSRPELGKRMGTSGQQVERLEKGQRRLAHDWIEKAAKALGVQQAAIIGDRPETAAVGTSIVPLNDDLGIVDVQNIDLAFGLGSTYTDSGVEIDTLPFPRSWMELITSSPPALLTWTRGRGDSMLPTIDDGDLILLDRSQRRVIEQDALWAFTVGDTASIKRLRVKGDRFQILSDNPSVPPDEEPIDFVNVVARVVFVGKRK